MKIEVALAYQEQEILIEVECPEASTLEHALLKSGIREKVPEFFKEFPDYKVGVFGKIVEKEQILNEGDRVEIYRRLTIDTMARRFYKVKNTRLPAKKHKWK